MKSLHEKAAEIYNESGQDGVIEWAKDLNYLDWKMCEPCDCVSPIAENSCLVCGSTIK